MNLAEVGALIAVFVSLMSVLVQWQRDRNKPQVDTATVSQINTSANIALIEPLTRRIDALEIELNEEREARKREHTEMRVELEDLRIGVGILTAQLVDAKMTPRWKPRNASSTPAPVSGFSGKR
jgi:hypothetical protein